MSSVALYTHKQGQQVYVRFRHWIVNGVCLNTLPPSIISPHVRMHKRQAGTFYSTWEIELYAGNDPKWLSQHKRALLAHVQDEFGCPHVTNIKIVGTK